MSTFPQLVGVPEDERPTRVPSGRERSGRDPLETAATVVLAAALFYVVLFWRLGAPSFWDPDEAHYAESTREMLATGDWLAPHYNQEPFFDKPALFHALQGLGMLAFGPTELGARIVPALAALALIGVTAWLGCAIGTRHLGLVAGLLLTASPGVFALARYAILDTVFTAFVFGGAALVAVAALKDRPRLQWPGYVLVALAVLTKGPVAAALCGLVLVLASLASGEVRRRLFGLRLMTGLALVVAIAAPWFVYMYLRFGRVFVDGYLLDENIRLFAASRFANQPGPWFYFHILAAGLLPFTGVVVGRLADDVMAVMRGERLDAFEVLLWAWVVAVVGFFTASTFKLDHYVFPAAPALSLLCARGWMDMRATPLARRHAATRAGAHLVGPVLVAMGIGLGYFLIARLELPRLAMVVPIIVTFCGAGLTIFINLRGRSGGHPPLVPWFALSALLAAYVGLVLFVIPALEHRKVMPDLARYVASRATADTRIATYRMNRWNSALRFYVDRHVVFLEDPVTAERFFASPQPFYCLMSLRASEEFVAQGAPLRVVYERDGIWATSGRALWRRRIPPAQFVVVTRAQ